MKLSGRWTRALAALGTVEGLALLYVAIPNAIFLAGWIVTPFGAIAAVALLVSVVSIIARTASFERLPLGTLWTLVIATAIAWCVVGGLGHFMYANSDWWVRDAVLLDLVRDPWPVVYDIDGVQTLLRTPVGFYLPSALVGKLLGVRAADLTTLAWTAAGVSMVFAMLLHNRPTLKVACIRVGIFICFSGMDIVPTLIRDYPHEIGAMIEWWPRFMQSPSQTTQLFWAPNHTIPGWIATAWLLGQDPRTMSIQRAVLFVVLTPIWAPLTALGIVPLVVAMIANRMRLDRNLASIREAVDGRVVLAAIACLALIYPYLVAGSDQIAIGFMSDIPWVGEDVVPRYLDFVLVEFFGFAALLLVRRPRDLLLWVSIVVLLALPFFRFGPYNDLVMRTSTPALTLLAIRMGEWLSSPVSATDSTMAHTIAIVLLAVGAVTPFMEIARPFLQPAWSMNVRSSLIEVTRGTHYLTPIDQPWLRRILRQPAQP